MEALSAVERRALSSLASCQSPGAQDVNPFLDVMPLLSDRDSEHHFCYKV